MASVGLLHTTEKTNCHYKCERAPQKNHWQMIVKHVDTSEILCHKWVIVSLVMHIKMIYKKIIGTCETCCQEVVSLNARKIKDVVVNN